MRFFITLAFAAFVAYAAWCAVAPMVATFEQHAARLAGI